MSERQFANCNPPGGTVYKSNKKQKGCCRRWKSLSGKSGEFIR